MNKRILCTVLALVMLVCALPTVLTGAARASDGEELPPDDYEGGLPGWNGTEIVLPPMPLP